MDKPDTSSSSPLDRIFRVVGFVIMTAVAFSLPLFPAAELDSSWRMALGKFFTDGLQFGTEVVFTYGPLGWAMGKTYWGGQWHALILWHAVQAVIFTSIVFWHAYRMKPGYGRLFFFTFFFVFGLTYEDAMHQIMIALAGMELIRRSDQPWRWDTLLWLLVLVPLALVKFTNLMLAGLLAGLASGLGVWERRKTSAALPLPIFVLAFVAGWAVCGQNPANLPRYFISSWQISQGYQDAMGFSCPPMQLYLGVTVLLLLVTYVGVNLFTHPRPVRSAFLSLGAGAFVYLNWKHGFIRADGHQIGFYYAAMTVAVCSPVLLDDGPRWTAFKHALLATAGLLSVIAADRVLPGVARGALGGAQAEVQTNLAFAFGLTNTRELYESRLQAERNALDLLKTKAKVGRASLDVLGFEQAVALYNGFNYRPRPVFQSYSAYTPYLAELNRDYLASDRAPEFLLFKLQSIDGRLATMDDPHALRLLLQRYTYLFTEMGFTVWQRNPGPFDARAVEPKLLHEYSPVLGEKLSLTELSGQNLWVEIDYRFSLLGKLRRFFFKPPLVQLRITDQQGGETVHRLPQPMGQAGFILNPVADDLMEFMRAAGGTPRRRIASISIETAPQDRDCLRDAIQVRVFSLPESKAGTDYFREADKALFHMFVHAPVSFTALNPPNEDLIDKRKVMIMHAPSEMVFDVPAGATEMQGYYGFIPGAYSDGGRTNGAEFVAYWSGGGEPVILHERYLDPVKKMGDRGLQKFSVKLPKGTGQVFLRINPGPFGEFAFDWTGWSGIEFK